MMKKDKIIYWISTGLFCAFLFLTSISYLTDPQFVEIYKHLGFPQYFRVELAIAKILGVQESVRKINNKTSKGWNIF